MTLFIDSLWRAAAYCLHIRVILYSLLPLVLMVAIAFGAGWFFWESAIDTVAAALGSWELVTVAHEWLSSVGLTGLKSVLPPLIVLLIATPVIVMLSLLAVATLMTPAMVRFVAARRFETLAQRHGGSFLSSVLGGLGATALALLAIVASRSRMVSVFTTLAISRLSRSTIGRGVRAGAARPRIVPTKKPGEISPNDGVSGSNASRSSELEARPLSVPALTSGAKVSMELIDMSTRPPITSLTGPAPPG